MAKKTGIAVRVYVDTADVADPVMGTPTWVEIPNQEGGTLTIEREEVQANHKQGNGWREAAAIARQWSVSCTGFSDPDDTAYLFLVDTKHLGVDLDVTVNVKVENDDGDTFIGKASLGAFEENFDISAWVSFSFEFSGRGALTVDRAA